MDLIQIAHERPDSPDVMRLIAQLDEYATSLYPSESNHLLSIDGLLAPEVTFLVARSGPAAVGCGALVDSGSFGELKRFFVLPDLRGRGIGKRILKELEAIALEKGLALLRLETGVSQPEAVALYRRAGFTEIAAFAPYAPDPLSLFFEKRLIPTGLDSRPAPR